MHRRDILLGAASSSVLTSPALALSDTLRLVMFGGHNPYYLGQVATNTFFPGNTSAVNTQINSSTVHYARDDIVSLQAVFVNAYGLNETSIGDATYTAALWSSTNTFVAPFKFNGATIGVVPGGTIIISDPLYRSIPNGTKINYRCFYQNPNGIIFYPLPFADAQFFSESAASGLTDKTQGGSLTANVNILPPTALIATTRKGSVGIIGDSIGYGTFAAPAGTGKDIGLFNAALGPSIAVMNLAAAGDAATGFLNVTKSKLRRQLLKYVSGIVTNYGNNDISANGRTPAQVKDDLVSIGRLPDIVGKPLYLSTLFPKTTNDGVFRTPSATESNRLAANSLIRSGVSGYTGIVDYDGVFNDPNFPGGWIRDGSGNIVTQDGTHVKLAGSVFGAAAGILTAAQFARQ